MDFATADTPFGTLNRDDPLTPSSTQICYLGSELRRDLLSPVAACGA